MSKNLLYDKYYNDLLCIFMVLDSINGADICQTLILTSKSEEQLKFEANRIINSYQFPLAKLGLSRKIICSNIEIKEFVKDFTAQQPYPIDLICTYFFLEEKTYKVIAKTTGFKVNTVKSYIHRFRNNFEDKISKNFTNHKLNNGEYQWIQ